MNGSTIGALSKAFSLLPVVKLRRLSDCRLPRLVDEGLEHVAGARHRDHARRAHVVHAVMEVVHAARVHDLLPPAVPPACHWFGRQQNLPASYRSQQLCVSEGLIHSGFKYIQVDSLRVGRT